MCSWNSLPLVVITITGIMVLCMISGFFSSVHSMVICSEVLTNCHSMQQKIAEAHKYCNGTYTKYHHSLAK